MSFVVSCDRCNFKATLENRGVPRYDLGDDLYHGMYTQSAWCHTCRSMVDAEKLPEVAELLERRAQLMTLVGTVDEKTGLVITEHRVSRNVDPMVRWRVNRLSPPRCLDCGSTEIVPHQPFEDGAFVHPECGGKIECDGEFIVEHWDHGHFFDPEGQALGVTPKGVTPHPALPGDKEPTP